VRPILAHIGLALFGLSLVGLRLFPILTACLVLLLTGLMARELGGSRRAQIVAGLAAVTALVLLFDGLFFSFTLSIHARDISIGRTGPPSFLLSQLYACANIAAIVLWVTGFWYYALAGHTFNRYGILNEETRD
jgi:hypothetical protein